MSLFNVSYALRKYAFPIESTFVYKPIKWSEDGDAVGFDCG